MSTIKDIIFDFIGLWSNQNQLYSMQCTVKSIDVTKRVCVCSPVDGSANLLNVRLEADITVDLEDEPIISTSKGWFVVPAVDSIVVVTFLSKTDAFISVWTIIDDIVVKSTNFTAEQTLFTFNDGSFGGLIKIDDLTTKLNSLVTEFNAFKDLYNSHIHITTATVGATAVPGVISPTTSSAAAATSFNKDDYKNIKVVHG